MSSVCRPDAKVRAVSESLVGIIMGSDSDWPTMSGAAEVLMEFEIAHEVRAAHDGAVRTALAYLERHAAFSRTGKAGVHQVDTKGYVAAAFVHRTSRALDPQLHTHVLVANKVRCADGKWRALDGRGGDPLAGCDPPAAHPQSRAADRHFSASTGYPSASQPSKPPARGLTRVIPNARSCSATRALVASFGQEQYSTMSRSRGIS